MGNLRVKTDTSVDEKTNYKRHLSTDDTFLSTTAPVSTLYKLHISLRRPSYLHNPADIPLLEQLS